MEASDSKLINDVIDRLKKQGLFDKFRKECMADVDTKPAYQNLTLRVQGAVEQFLLSQKWSADLNKNQLRESLRRHLNDLNMLTSGVDRVVDQVVNPKIHKEFKPQIDRVVCEFLNVDYDAWLAQQNALRFWSQIPSNNVDNNQRSSGNFAKQKSIPSLLDIKFQAPVQSGFVNASPLLTDIPPHPVMSHPSVPPPPLLPPRLHPGPHSSVVVQSNVPMGLTPPVGNSQTTSCVPPPPPTISGGLGVAPTIPVAPQVQSQFPCLGAVGASAGPPGIVRLTERVPLNMNDLPAVNLGDRSTMPITVGDVPTRCINEQRGVRFPPVDNSKFGLTYEFDNHRSNYYGTYSGTSTYPSQITPSFPNLPAENFAYGVGSADPIMSYVMSRAQELLMNPPLPQMEIDRPPLPAEEDTKELHMTKTARDREARKRRKERRRLEQAMSLSTGAELIVGNVSEADTRETTNGGRLESTVSDSEKLDSDKGFKNKPQLPQVSGSVKDETFSLVAVKEAEESDEPTKEYHFAWDNVDEDCLSDVTVSSVHTSDLSSFDEDADHAAQNSENDDDDDFCPASGSVDAATATMESEPAETKETVEDAVEDNSHVSPVVAKRKSKKPYHLQYYNESDSDNEETREQRKARLAQEKEDRYLRRQQRRLELEMKRKERVADKSSSVIESKSDETCASASASASEVALECEVVNPEEDKNIAEEVVELDGLCVTVEIVDNTAVKTDKTDLQDTSDTQSKSESIQGQGTPVQPRGRRTKSQMKQELRERKVQEKQLELRRQRTRNRKYMSDDFTSIFTENKVLMSSSGYADDDKKDIVSGSDFIQEEIVETGVEQSIEIAECVEVGSSSSSDEDDDDSRQDDDSRPGSPYSDISNSTVYSISSDSEEKSSSDEAPSPSEKAASKKNSKTERNARNPSPEYASPQTKRRRLSPEPRQSSSQRFSPHSSPRNRHDSPYGRTRDDIMSSSSRQKDDSPHGKRDDLTRAVLKPRGSPPHSVGSREGARREPTRSFSDIPRVRGVRMRQVGGSRSRNHLYDLPKVSDSPAVGVRTQQSDTARDSSRRRKDPLISNRETGSRRETANSAEQTSRLSDNLGRRSDSEVRASRRRDDSVVGSIDPSVDVATRSSEKKRSTRQQYSTSDLYKPHTSRRRRSPSVDQRNQTAHPDHRGERYQPDAHNTEGRTQSSRIKRGVPPASRESFSRAISPSRVRSNSPALCHDSFANSVSPLRKQSGSPAAGRDGFVGALSPSRMRNSSPTFRDNYRSGTSPGLGRTISPGPRDSYRGGTSPARGRTNSPGPRDNYRSGTSPGLGRTISPGPRDSYRGGTSPARGRTNSPGPRDNYRSGTSPGLGRTISPGPRDSYRGGTSPGRGRHVSPVPRESYRCGISPGRGRTISPVPPRDSYRSGTSPGRGRPLSPVSRSELSRPVSPTSSRHRSDFPSPSRSPRSRQLTTTLHRSHSSPFHAYNHSPTRVLESVYHDADYMHHLPAPISMSRDLEWRRNTPPPLPAPPSYSDLCQSDVPVGWLPRHVYSTSPVSSPLLAPPKPRRSRSPEEKSSSSSSRSRSRDRPSSHVVWESRSPRPATGQSGPSSRRSVRSGYPRVYHPETAASSDTNKAPGRHGRIHTVREETVVYAGRMESGLDSDSNPIVKTRSSSRKRREDTAPIAKRLRR